MALLYGVQTERVGCCPITSASPRESRRWNLAHSFWRARCPDSRGVPAATAQGGDSAYTGAVFTLLPEKDWSWQGIIQPSPGRLTVLCCLSPANPPDGHGGWCGWDTNSDFCVLMAKCRTWSPSAAGSLACLSTHPLQEHGCELPHTAVCAPRREGGVKQLLKKSTSLQVVKCTEMQPASAEGISTARQG